MAFLKERTYFTVRCGMENGADAPTFPVPTGPRTWEYLNQYNRECEEWIKSFTEKEPYPMVRKYHMEYHRKVYTGRAIIYRPDTKENGLPMMLYTHGGSFAFWTPEYKDFMCANIAEQGNCIVVNLDFRQNVDGIMVADMYEDAYAGILEAVSRAEEYGGDKSRIGIMGDSAGGQMALGMSIMCRDRGQVKISHRVILAGGIGFAPDDLDNGNVNAGVSDLMGTVNVVKRGFKSIEESLHPYYSPIYDPKMSEAPSTTFIVGTADYMWREQAIYARKLTEAGVEAEVALYPGMPHDFYSGSSMTQAKDAWKYIGERIRKYLSA